jgi:predicted RNA-binding protein YlqC (UPF0109 family)
MRDLVFHLVRPLVTHPEDLQVQIVEGEATVMLEMSVHPDDQERIEGENGRTMRAIRNILSAAAGRRKATLDLVDVNALGAGEE